ncbi:gag protein [Aphelenchoides avenae]|nr:gag protein [Aphelenchus avenae]
MLEKKYGDVENLQNHLMQDLVDITAPSVKVSELAVFHHTAFQTVQNLKRTNLDLGQSRIVEQLLLGKLPTSIKVKIIDKADGKPITPTFILDELLSYVNVQQRAHSSGLTLHRPPSNAVNASRPRSDSRPRSPGPPYGNGGNNNRPTHNNGTYVADTETTYVAFKQPRQRCNFCGGDHWSARCNEFPTVALRIRRIQALKHCFLCLGGSHWSDKCPHRAKDPCKHCQKGQHHAAICRTFMGESRPGTPRPTPDQSLTSTGGSEPRPTVGRAAQPSTPHSTGGAASPSTGGTATTSRQTPAKAVTGKEATGAATANNVRPPSAQNSHETVSGNSKNNRKSQRGNNNSKK